MLTVSVLTEIMSLKPLMMKNLENLSKFGTRRVLEEDKFQRRKEGNKEWEAREEVNK